MICVFCRSPIEEPEGDECGSNFGVCSECEETETSDTSIEEEDTEEISTREIIEELSRQIFRDATE